MALDRSTQPIVKDASGVLVGVAQVRIGRPSIRAVGTATTHNGIIPVGKSKKVKSASNAAVIVVKPDEIYTANGATTPALSVTTFNYSGKGDGAIIIRATSTAGAGVNEEASSAVAADKIEVFNTYGEITVTSTSLASQSYTVQGVIFTAAFTGAKVGDTWTIPCWGPGGINLNQTGIVSPFSMYASTDASGSVGGLKSASFQPKIDGIKKLESGFPSYVADQVIDKVSVDLSWSGYEYTNSNLTLLKSMISKVINNGELSAISVEMVMRTRGGSLVRMWVPSCTFTSLPTYAPTNDYSDVAFQMSALKQTEFTVLGASTGITDVSTAGTPSQLAIYNAWLSEAPLYSELPY